MIAAVWQAASLDGLLLLLAACTMAGVVRGFTGFGTGLVFMPIAALVVEPVWAILIMVTFDAFGPIPLLPRALRDGEPRDVTLLMVGAVVGLPIGVYLLTQLDPIVFRWMVSSLSLLMLVLLMSGWRYRNPLNAMCTSLVGAMGGFMCGIAALPGPPVILSYMSSPRRPAVIRANTTMYLFLVDILTFLVFAIKGLVVMIPVVIGMILVIPYSLAALAGQHAFDPENVTLYRRAAYALIAGSALIGLPVWD